MTMLLFKNARVIDVGGRTLMPGLIDAHMHAYASDVNMFKVEALGRRGGARLQVDVLPPIPSG
jgi:predicted amidohydrolase YtcJ